MLQYSESPLGVSVAHSANATEVKNLFRCDVKGYNLKLKTFL